MITLPLVYFVSCSIFSRFQLHVCYVGPHSGPCPEEEYVLPYLILIYDPWVGFCLSPQFLHFLVPPLCLVSITTYYTYCWLLPGLFPIYNVVFFWDYILIPPPIYPEPCLLTILFLCQFLKPLCLSHYNSQCLTRSCTFSQSFMESTAVSVAAVCHWFYPWLCCRLP